MNYSALSTDPIKQKSDCLVVGVVEGKSQSAVWTELDQQCKGVLGKLLSSGDISSKLAATSWFYPQEGGIKRLLFVGLGKEKELSEAGFRKAAKSVMQSLSKSGAGNAVVALSSLTLNALKAGWATEQLVVALESACYTFDNMKSEKATPTKVSQVKVAGDKRDKSAIEAAIAKAGAVAKGMSLTKDLGNLPGNVCTPDYLAKQAKALAKEYKSLKAEALGEKEMKELGMGSFLSVSAGSDQPARLIVIEYKGGDDKQKPHVLVGKGITFDSGGISLKPGEGMDEMKYDMCGAASVFGTLLALAEMKAPINVVGVIAAAENMPSGKATKPGDIVTTMSGQTVEILNTDAEGRLVLCDALTYCERFKPETVVDIATLTGACIIALGNHATGLLANDDKLADALLAAGESTGDRAWRLPLWDEYQTQLDSNFADMQNIGGRPAGTITAACFLSRFTKKYRWAHLDIAGVAWTSGKDKGASGRPVPLLTEYLLGQVKG
ncbi:leucyl aminopeptidase [Hahella aquimaris]|uniref:leucyl aminopeptidase n=1 Tax=Hahella sp. HNIBRBA332 TaxID=3015983 RepID=UPI00273C504E|nr:leucyl aminopeptidase [Hahella sp. HNIBRBA332]WLQ11403.1 leucyl aminopeptidase [Hahella sp. HNIBRBA332]